MTNLQKALKMRIELDRQAKRVLLQALKDGYIESGQLKQLESGKADELSKSDEDLERELLELERKLYPETCLLLQRAGMCFELNDRRETL